MEVIPLIRSSATGSESSKGDNGIKRHVQEWSRMDRLTGILEHARVEADQWTNHTANTKHKYGKVCYVDAVYDNNYRYNSRRISYNDKDEFLIFWVGKNIVFMYRKNQIKLYTRIDRYSYPRCL